jgi:hypothetical protein
LDIITTPEIGPMMIYQNNLHQNKSIAFEIRDYQGNSQGIGAKIFIYYGEGKHQYREILLSGGYKSYDESIAFFGLGDHQKVDRVEIHWSTGEKMEFNQPFESGHRYRIIRNDKH